MSHTITPSQLSEMIDSRQSLRLIDVRNPDEYADSHIPQALNIPMDQIEARLKDFGKGEGVVLLCQSGRRATLCQELLAGKLAQASVLEGGTVAWIEAGYETVGNKVVGLPIMRQVQLTAGLLIVLGSILALAVGPNWIGLTLFVGCGFTIAGATGFCGMARLLAIMPWNRA